MNTNIQREINGASRETPATNVWLWMEASVLKLLKP